MSSVSVPVMDDMLAEGVNETFDLTLIVPSSFSPSIRVDKRRRAIGIITDTTSKCIYKTQEFLTTVLCSVSNRF